MDKKARPCVNVGPLINLINVCDMTLEHDHIIRCNFLLDRTFCYVNILVSDLIGVSTATKTFGPTIARLVVDRHCGPRWQSPYCGGTVPLLTGTDRLEDPHGVLLASLFGWVEWEGGTRSGVLSPSKRIEWVAHFIDRTVPLVQRSGFTVANRAVPVRFRGGILWGLSSVVEQLLCKQMVAGSIPAGSIPFFFSFKRECHLMAS
jgi:hypothetical protein